MNLTRQLYRERLACHAFSFVEYIHFARNRLLSLARNAIVLVLLLFSWNANSKPPSLRNGDIVFQTSRSAQSLAIQRATGSPYSHMGIVILRSGKPFVFEAVRTVRYTPLDAWIARGIGGHFVAKRLENASFILDATGEKRLRDAARDFEGRPYDPSFEWTDERIYCSELVWKMYRRALGIELGRLQKIREFDLEDPEVRRKLKERYGRQVPLEESAISPEAIFKSSRLTTVLER